MNDIDEICEGTFPINSKFIKTYQREEPSITDRYKDGTYQQGSFHRCINIDLKLITCKDKIVIP